MLRATLRLYALVFLAGGLLFVFAEPLVLEVVSLAGTPLPAGGPSLWLGLTGSLMTVLAALAWRLSRAPATDAAWDALMLSKAVSSGLFALFAARTRNPAFVVGALVDGSILVHLAFLRAGFEAARDPLAPRSGPPSYEAWFVRLCDPATGRALWVRRSLVAGAPRCWAVFTDPAAGTPVVRSWSGGEGAWELAPGRAAGGGAGASWSLAWEPGPCPPLRVVPAWLNALGFPRGYADAAPAARFTGTATLDGKEWRFASAPGSVGHLWGEGLGRGWRWAHAPCADGSVVEVLSAPLGCGLRATAAYLFRGGLLVRSASALALLRNRTEAKGRGWSFAARAEGFALDGELAPGPEAVLRYETPDGAALSCRSSTAARLTARLSGAGGGADLTSDGAAVETAEPA